MLLKKKKEIEKKRGKPRTVNCYKTLPEYWRRLPTHIVYISNITDYLNYLHKELM